MTEHPPLEQAFWISHCLLLVVAFLAAVIGLVQVTIFKRIELFKFLEQEMIKDARSLVYQKTEKFGRAEWWREDLDGERAASIVCSSFNVVGHLASRLNRRFFAKRWWFTICWTYEALEGFMEYREKKAPNLFEGYKKLYKTAKRFDRRTQSLTGQKNSN